MTVYGLSKERKLNELSRAKQGNSQLTKHKFKRAILISMSFFNFEHAIILHTLHKDEAPKRTASPSCLIQQWDIRSVDSG